MPQQTDSETEGSTNPDEPATGSPWTHVLHWACYSTAWTVTVLLLAVAALRIFAHDSANFLIWLNAFSAYLYLPVYFCLIWALWQKKKWLILACCTIIAFHLVWMKPDFMRDGRFDMPPEIASRAEPSQVVRIFFANVSRFNPEHDAMLEEIANTNPDVILLAEYSRPWYEAFRASPIMAPYIYGTGMLRAHPGSVGVFSKIPIESEKLEWVESRGEDTSVFRLGESTFSIVGLHAPRPINFPSQDYESYWKHTLPKLRNMAGPTVIIGDFNATQHSDVYRQLKESRYRSAHEDRGRGYATTWPNGEGLFPPIRIDQAFLSPEIECLDIAEGGGKGSDHKPLILDLRIRDKDAKSFTTGASTGS